MSRKSRKHISAKRRRNTLRHIAVMAMVGLCILIGVALVWTSANLEIIGREEAIPAKATFQRAVGEWRHRGYKRRGYRQAGLSLEFSDRDTMEVPYNWFDVAISEELPYTDKFRRPVQLADLPSGTVCTILADPQKPDDILHLETEEGTVIVSFEESMETVERMKKNRHIFGCLLICTGIAGGLWEAFLYRKRMQKFKAPPHNVPHRSAAAFPQSPT